MRKYNVENYIRYKEDLKSTLGSKLYERKDYENLSRDQLIIKFLPGKLLVFKLPVASIFPSDLIRSLS